MKPDHSRAFQYLLTCSRRSPGAFRPRDLAAITEIKRMIKDDGATFTDRDRATIRDIWGSTIPDKPFPSQE